MQNFDRVEVPPAREASASSGGSSPSARTPRTPKASSAMSRRARSVVFAVLCQCVQMFMSYDGGALPASLDELEAIQGVSIPEVEMGMLNAMDKVGMVLASVPWGWALQRCPAKFLMIISLALNAGFTVAFGFMASSMPFLYAAKFVMGATQALQGVWGTVWTSSMAPLDLKATWMGLGAVSAGLGTGIGTSVAGYGTANGLPFWFAFVVSGGILCFLWLFLLFVPPRWIAVQEEEEQDALALSRRSPQGDGQDHKFRNKLYLWIMTMLAIALTQFQAAAFAYLFIRLFQVVWATGPGEDEGLNKNWVTTMNLIVPGGGGVVGIIVGPPLIDARGGYSTPLGVVRSLSLLVKFQLVAGLGGILGACSLYGKAHETGYSDEWGDMWLYLTWVAIALVMAAQNACVAALCGINCEVPPERLRTQASGFEISFRNIFGFVAGNMVPAVVMQMNSYSKPETQFCWGLGVVFILNVLGAPLCGAAWQAASHELTDKRHEAMQELHKALQMKSDIKIRAAVDNAEGLDLDQWAGGSILLEIARETLGQCNTRERSRSDATHIGRSADVELMRMDAAQEVINKQREEIARLKSENLRLLSQQSKGGSPPSSPSSPVGANGSL